MAWKKGFNFRSTSGYVTDGTDDTYVLATDTSATTRNGVTFQWSASPNVPRDRSAAVDAKLAGIHGVDGIDECTFSVTLPATGDYRIKFALGDQASLQGNMRIRILDDATGLIDLNSKTTTGAAYFFDATNVERTSVADWVSNNAAATHTFATTSFKLILGQTGARNGFLAHLELEQVATGPAVAVLAHHLRTQGIS
jgi:hypothetical protein